jgi:hypothetical protein
MLVIGKHAAQALRLWQGQQLPRNRAWPRTAVARMRDIGAHGLGLIYKYLIYNE